MASITVQAFEEKHVNDALHSLSVFELVFVARGQGQWQVGEYSFEFGPGFLCLAPPSALRRWRWGGAGLGAANASGWVLRFGRECLPQGLLRLPELSAVAGLLEDAAGGLRFQVQDRERLTMRLRSIQRATGAMRYARFLAALGLVAGLRRAQVAEIESIGAKAKARSAARWTTVLRYLDQVPLNVVSREEAARVAGLDPAAFSRFFRQQSGATFVDYVANLRVRAAARLLGSRRDLTVAEVARRSGFRSESALHRQFKQRLGTTPHAYRRAANAESQTP